MYRYTIQFIDELNDEKLSEKGICSGANYGEATNKVVAYYGAENVIEIKIYEIEDILCDEELKNELGEN